LTIYALQYDEFLSESDFNLYHQDSLKANWNLQFDNVFGNPPYVKFQDLSDESRDYLTKNWTTVEGGTFNLYFAFFELGYKLLKPTGQLGYITPNNYFTSLAGESLRKYFQNKKCVTRIVDFSHKKVFDAQTYTAITFLNKQKNESITYDRIKPNLSPEIIFKKCKRLAKLLGKSKHKKMAFIKI
jgi:adenine-specific DNA-methyltransferase